MSLMILLDTLVAAPDTVAALSILASDTLAAAPSMASADTLALDRANLAAAGTITDEPSITDWLQAGAAVVGTLAAVFAGIFAYLSYRGTIKQQQDQLDEQQKELSALTSIAEGLVMQNNQSIKRRRFEIKPNLTLVTKSYSGHQFAVVVENVGETATDLKVHNIYGFDCSISDGTTTMYNRERKTIEVRMGSQNISKILNMFDIRIYFTDKDQNEYVQIILGRDGVLHYLTPVHLGHFSDWDNVESERFKKYNGRKHQEIFDLHKLTSVSN